jgi:hypothetical protein
MHAYKDAACGFRANIMLLCGGLLDLMDLSGGLVLPVASML